MHKKKTLRTQCSVWLMRWSVLSDVVCPKCLRVIQTVRPATCMATHCCKSVCVSVCVQIPLSQTRFVIVQCMGKVKFLLQCFLFPPFPSFFSLNRLHLCNRKFNLFSSLINPICNSLDWITAKTASEKGVLLAQCAWGHGCKEPHPWHLELLSICRSHLYKWA